MLLEKMLLDTQVLRTKGNLNICITNLHSDSRQIREGGLFAVIRGTTLDGADYIGDAISHGAVALLVSEQEQDRCQEVDGCAVIVVEDVRKALATMAATFYDHPEEKLRLIGVTGTKGKTTTTFMLQKILEAGGKRVGLIGTIAAYAGAEKLCDTERTTPESFELLRLMALMVERGMEIAILEVSSQAMKLSRVYGFPFEVAVFTNFSEDHISPKEHASMEEYFACKEALIASAKKAVLNVDDRAVKALASKIENGLTFGLLEEAYVSARKDEIHLAPDQVEFTAQVAGESFPVTVSIPGVFSVYNALAAIAAATCMGACKEDIISALSTISVRGRCEMVPNALGIHVMIDYAHTPASLESILKTVKEFCTGKVICAWGVGGDRDRDKRPIMGEISGKYADFTVLMSDQVRTEDPMQILKDIETGIVKTGAPYTIIEDRTQGITYALGIARPGDFVVIPGLGHDMYLERNGVKHPYDERAVIAKVCKNLQAKQPVEQA